VAAADPLPKGMIEEKVYMPRDLPPRRIPKRWLSGLEDLVVDTACHKVIYFHFSSIVYAD
jgi:hypothetical protein